MIKDVKDIFPDTFSTDVYDKKRMNGKYQVGSGRIVTVTHDTPFIEDIVPQDGKKSQEKNSYQQKRVSNRTILSNALESAIDTSTQAGQNELKWLKEYQSKIATIETEEAHLAEVDENGKKVQKPVLVSLELLPTNKKKTAILDFSIITSAYSKSALQRYLNENSILYIEPNKKRTNNWLSLNRLQLPLGENRYGSVRKITYLGNKVKIENSKNLTPMQKALYESGAGDAYLF